MARPRKTSRASAPDVAAGDLPSAAQSVGRRLAYELRQVLQAVGWPGLSIRALSRTLGVDANICQRAVAAASSDDQPDRVLLKTPGVEGLDLLRRACARRGVRPDLLEALHTATFELEALISRHGGSLRRVRASLGSMGGQTNTTDGADSVSRRRSAWRAVSGYVGAQLDTHAVAVFMRLPRGGAHDGAAAASVLEGFSLNAYAAWRGTEGGLPLLLSTFGGGEQIASGPFSKGGRILDEFSTQPRKLLTQRTPTPGATLQVLDNTPEKDRSASPVDLTLLNPLVGVSNPLTEASRQHTSFVRVRYPARELLLDVLLDRELAARCVPTPSIAWAGPWLTRGEQMPWYDRVPGDEGVVVMPADRLTNPCSHCPWYARALRHASDLAGWSLAEFVCYRLHVRYPLWGAAHLIRFDFSGSTAAA